MGHKFSKSRTPGDAYQAQQKCAKHGRIVTCVVEIYDRFDAPRCTPGGGKYTSSRKKYKKKCRQTDRRYIFSVSVLSLLRLLMVLNDLANTPPPPSACLKAGY